MKDDESFQYRKQCTKINKKNLCHKTVALALQIKRGITFQYSSFLSKRNILRKCLYYCVSNLACADSVCGGATSSSHVQNALYTISLQRYNMNQS